MQAEDYDRGGETVAYHDNTPTNLGGVYRATDAVDLQLTSDVGDGHIVGFIQAGEWLEYTLNVPATAAFDVDFRVASLGRGGTFHLEQDGIRRTGPIAIPDTGGWQNWRTLTLPNVQLTAGNASVFRLVFDTPGTTLGYVGNMNWIGFRAKA
jgi:hypothetical protein